MGDVGDVHDLTPMTDLERVMRTLVQGVAYDEAFAAVQGALAHALGRPATVAEYRAALLECAAAYLLEARRL